MLVVVKEIRKQVPDRQAHIGRGIHTGSYLLGRLGFDGDLAPVLGLSKRLAPASRTPFGHALIAVPPEPRHGYGLLVSIAVEKRVFGHRSSHRLTKR